MLIITLKLDYNDHFIKNMNFSFKELVMDELDLMLKNNTDLVTKFNLDKGLSINDVMHIFILVNPPLVTPF